MALVRLSEVEWRAREAAHHARVHELTAEHLARRAAGQTHPVDDFLWNYYGHAPAKLRRWHPGAGFVLEGASQDERSGWRHMTAHGSPDAPEHGAAHGTALRPGDVTIDLPAFMEKRAKTVGFVRRILSATLGRPMNTGCFGLHEWAMVYRDSEAVRHEGWPLRLGEAGTNAVLKAGTLRCTHFDATRFFTTEGARRNTLEPAPTRDSQEADENPGCLHAGMDLYKWAFKLAPALPSELAADAFELAQALRTLDMQASPYDFRALGYEAVPIETPEGRHEYAIRQRSLGDRGNALRERLLAGLDGLDAAHASATSADLKGTAKQQPKASKPTTLRFG